MIKTSSFERQSAQFVTDLGNAVRRNPVSTALIGMGLLWLFTGGKTVDRAADLARRTGLDRVPDAAADALAAGRSAVKDQVDKLGGRFSDVTDEASSMAQAATRAVRDTGSATFEGASRMASDFAHQASDFGRSIPETGAQLFGSARSNLTDLFNEQPLMLGAIGVAIGAGIAASLPATEMEAQYFGQSSDEFKAKASEFAQQQADRAQEVVRDVAAAAADEARRQGLSPENLKAAVGELGEKMKRVVESADANVRGG
jgi:hypothetical protein